MAAPISRGTSRSRSEQTFRTRDGFGEAEMAPRKRKQNADEKALPEVTAAERVAAEKYRARLAAAKPRVRVKVSNEGGPEPNAARPYDKMTSQERTAVDKFFARNAANPAPGLKVLKGQAATISPNHPDDLAGTMLLMDALGTGDLDFYLGLLNQLATAVSKGGQVDERRLNFMLSVMKGVQPRDQLETMLAAQMAAVHMATITIAQQLADVENVPQQDSAERAFNKLSRTFTTQMEALKRYRTGGEQKVTVQHVSVTEGGQAIVGNVTQAARDAAPEKPASSTPALTDAQKPPLTILGEPARAAVPSRRRQKDD